MIDQINQQWENVSIHVKHLHQTPINNIHFVRIRNQLHIQIFHFHRLYVYNYLYTSNIIMSQIHYSNI